MRAWQVYLGFGIAAFAVYAINAPRAQDYEHVLEVQGYTNIELTGYSWSDCGSGDVYNSTWEAELNGQPVKGVSCKGLLKSFTTRIRN